MPLPALPPAYNLVALDPEVDAFERAVRAAPRGLDDGTIYWTDRADRLDLAVALEPEASSSTALKALYVLTVAAGDALDALAPPVESVAFAWPGHVLADGARLGRVRAALAPVTGADAVPPWLVLGLRLAVGRLGGVAVPALLESVAGHYLCWTGRWREEGLEPVRASWNRRCFQHGQFGELVLDRTRFAGPVRGLAEDGTFVIDESRLDLFRHLACIN